MPGPNRLWMTVSGLMVARKDRSTGVGGLFDCDGGVPMRNKQKTVEIGDKYKF